MFGGAVWWEAARSSVGPEFGQPEAAPGFDQVEMSDAAAQSGQRRRRPRDRAQPPEGGREQVLRRERKLEPGPVVLEDA